MNPDSQNSTPQPYTILRIKRKRNEEPLDALVVESAMPRKKSRGRMGMFQFAQTVEPEAWEDEARQKDIQEQIKRLAREDATKVASDAADCSATPPPITQTPSLKDNRRYTIINREEEVRERPRLPTSPPAVVSSKDAASEKGPSIRMYDAVLSSGDTELDPEMEKFMPLIRDYLKLHDISPADALQNAADQKGTSTDSDDYVWDVFYHRPATLSEWNNVAANVGTLTGLPPSLDDMHDSDSDDEVVDEADEDSNAEEYYKNDYPDEEESSDEDSEGSDCFHERSDYEELLIRDDDDHDWR